MQSLPSHAFFPGECNVSASAGRHRASQKADFQILGDSFRSRRGSEPRSRQKDLNFQRVGAATYTNASAPIQFAAIAAFGVDEDMTGYIEAQRDMHRIMTTDLARRFQELEGVDVTTPQGSFYFFADFEGLRDKLAGKGIQTSVELGDLLYDHPHRIAVVAGDYLIMRDPIVLRVEAQGLTA